LGGDSFKVSLDVAKSTVGEAKAEIARMQGIEVARQELYRVAVREDGKAVREDDAEPELLDDDLLALEGGDVVAMAVKELPPLGWQTFSEEYVELSEGGIVATQLKDHKEEQDEEGEEVFAFSHVTTGIELTEGRHYWEVELLSKDVNAIYVGVSRPNLDPVGDYMDSNCADGWFINAGFGVLYGNGKDHDNAAGEYAAGEYEQGDRVGVLLDLNNGSQLFFKNGVQNGPGYAAGSVTGPVVAAVELKWEGDKVRLHADVAFPAGHAQ
jgi:hypothetical protein